MKKSSGFTLIELMVSMALGLIILIGIMQVLLINLQSQRVQEGISRMQESARFALEEVAYQVRNAGYLGCISSSASMTNTLKNPDAFDANFAVAIIGFDGNTSATGGWTPSKPDTIPNTASPDSDIISIRAVTDVGMFTTQSMPTTAAALHVTQSDEVVKGDILLITDCQQSAVFQATQYNNKNTIVHNTGNGGGLAPPNNATKDLGKRYDVGSEVLKLTQINYFIQESAAGDGPALWQQTFSRTPVELAPYVERFHVTFGHDTDSNGVVDEYFSADHASINWEQVVAARIFLLMRSPEQLPIDIDQRTFTIAGEDFGPFNDRYARQLFTKTISIRNRLP